jgi:hypothetical protein
LAVVDPCGGGAAAGADSGRFVEVLPGGHGLLATGVVVGVFDGILLGAVSLGDVAFEIIDCKSAGGIRQDDLNLTTHIIIDEAGF